MTAYYCDTEDCSGMLIKAIDSGGAGTCPVGPSSGVIGASLDLDIEQYIPPPYELETGRDEEFYVYKKLAGGNEFTGCNPAVCYAGMPRSSLSACWSDIHCDDDDYRWCWACQDQFLFSSIVDFGHNYSGTSLVLTGGGISPAEFDPLTYIYTTQFYEPSPPLYTMTATLTEDIDGEVEDPDYPRPRTLVKSEDFNVIGDSYGIRIVSGDGQIGAPGQPLVEPLVVEVYNKRTLERAILDGIQINFSVSGGVLSVASMMNNLLSGDFQPLSGSDPNVATLDPETCTTTAGECQTYVTTSSLHLGDFVV